MNRMRIHPTAGQGDEKQQLAVKYKKLPDPDEFADDFLFGYLLAVKRARRSTRSVPPRGAAILLNTSFQEKMY